MLDRPDYARIASRFREYAIICRERVAGLPREYQMELLRMAARWERDAEVVLRDGAVIAATRAFLDGITREGPDEQRHRGASFVVEECAIRGEHPRLALLAFSVVPRFPLVGGLQGYSEHQAP